MTSPDTMEAENVPCPYCDGFVVWSWGHYCCVDCPWSVLDIAPMLTVTGAQIRDLFLP